MSDQPIKVGKLCLLAAPYKINFFQYKLILERRVPWNLGIPSRFTTAAAYLSQTVNDKCSCIPLSVLQMTKSWVEPGNEAT